MITKEEKLRLMMLSTELRQQGKDEEALSVSKQIPLAPHVAMAAKEVYGSQYLKNSGLNLSEAEDVYGKDWLNK